MSRAPGRKKAVESAYGLGSLWNDTKELPTLSTYRMVIHHTVQAWRSFLTSPLTSVLTTITIATALLVFSIFVLVVENVRSVVASAGKDISVSVYLKDSLADENIKKLTAEMKALDFIEKVELKTKVQALEDFRGTLGEQGSILEGLDNNNPLPASLEVSFKHIEEIEKKLDEFVKKYSALEGVEHVLYSRALVDRLSGFLRFLRFSGAIGIVFMLLITSFIITNTIRLALYAHREEIEIMKLVGATDGFVRAPYVIEGFVQGLVGALIALFISYGCYMLFHDALKSNELLRGLLPTFNYLTLRSVMLIIVSGIAVGICGSILAVRKFLET